MTNRANKQNRAGRPRGGGGQAKVLSTDELGRVEKCLAGTRTAIRDRALLLLQYATGMRAGELGALDVGDVLHLGAIRREFASARTIRSIAARAPSTWRARRPSIPCWPTSGAATRS